MMPHRPRSTSASILRAVVFITIAIAFRPSQAATIWIGPDTTWTKSAATPSDNIVPGKVNLTRASRQVLYNLAARETAAGLGSPADTLWAFGNLSDYATLTYQSLESMRNGNLAARILNQPMVVHLLSDDIYLSIRFTTWASGPFGSGAVAYTRSTPSPGASFTSPLAGAVFAAPANVGLTVNATLVGGVVTNVSFFEQANFLGSVQTAPFKFIASNLPAGPHSFSAIATGSGLSGTSSVANVTVIIPADVSLSGATKQANGLFSFNYTADKGLRYVVQRTADLNPPITWVPVLTNVASANLVHIAQSITTTNRYFRVGLLPNP